MDEPKRDVVHRWLFKAQHDLASARRLADNNEPLLDTVFAPPPPILGE